jgi:hypothetical protein
MTAAATVESAMKVILKNDVPHCHERLATEATK